MSFVALSVIEMKAAIFDSTPVSQDIVDFPMLLRTNCTKWCLLQTSGCALLFFCDRERQFLKSFFFCFLLDQVKICLSMEQFIEIDVLPAMKSIFSQDNLCQCEEPIRGPG